VEVVTVVDDEVVVVEIVPLMEQAHG